MTFDRRMALGAVKLAVAAALLAWLVHSGLLSAQTLAPALARPGWLAAGVAALFGVAVFAGMRWHYLLQAQGMRPNMGVSLRLAFEGLFFTLVVPGGVTGDILRIYHSARLPGGHRAGALASVVFDRVLHLTLFLAFAVLALCLHPVLVHDNAHLRAAAGFLALYFVGAAAAGALVSSEMVRRHPWVEAALRRMPFSAAVTRLYDAAHAYRAHPARLAAAVAAGAAAVLGSMAAYYFIGRALGATALGPGDYLLVVPLIAVASVLPITPGGVGVAQAAAVVVFSWVGADAALGVNVVTLVQAASVFVSLPGAVLYLTHREEAQRAAASEHV